MPQFENISKISITVGGAQLSPVQIAHLIECTVEQSMYAPDAIVMRFHDPKLEFADNNSFALGAEVEVKMAQGFENSPLIVTKGEVFSVEPNMVSGQGFETVVVAFHKFNRLHHGRRTRSFLDQKDSDVFKTIIGGVGLSTDIDATTTQYPYLVQWNQTDMEFLRERAERIGYMVYTDAAKVYIKKWDNSPAPDVTLSLSNGLIAFRPRLTLAKQVSAVKVRVWDPQTKAALEGVAAAPSNSKQGGSSSTGAAFVETAYGASTMTFVDPSAKDATDAKAIADGYINQLTRENTEAEADCMGSAALRPGATVKIEDVGTRFSGNYTITTARHVYNSNGYATSISMSGSFAERIGDMLGAANRPDQVSGVMPAVVTNLDDPDQKGRVKVKFGQMPQNEGVDLESGWMRISMPMTGNQRGFQFYPEVGDEVLVAFDSGDPSTGYIVGGLWNGQDAAPMAAGDHLSGSTVKKRTFKSKAGHELIFAEDNDADLSVTLKDVKGNTILLDAKNEKLIITAKKDMEINVENDFKLAVKGNITIDGTKNIDMNAKQNITVAATSNLDLKATSNATLKANSQVTVEGMTGATVKSSATLQLSGTAMAELKGGIVRIN